MDFSRPRRTDPRPSALAFWLLVVAAMVFAIVVVGGITRLTESGLSITEWKPIRGIIPPLTEAQWQAEFAGYKAIPQYKAFNTSMTLAGFQQIYFWEYLHRLLARTIGLVMALVLLVFWWRRAIPDGFGWRMIVILLLGGLQGVIGWWMVASGLQYRTEVSHIRLAIHLLAALLIFSALVWTALDLRLEADDPGGRHARLPRHGAVVLALLALQIMFGAFTAGLRAGYAFAEWPTMGGSFFPEGVAFLAPAWRNLVDQPIVIQFVHRWLAWVVAAGVLGLAIRAFRYRLNAAPAAVLIAVACQIALGIATLLSGVRIDIAVAHQAMAVLLLAATLATAHGIGARQR
jgi:heme a synthase